VGYLAGAFDVWVIRHFWRPLLVAVPADLATSFLDGDNGTINVITFASVFAVSQAVFLVLARRRRARGRLSLPELVMRWYGTRLHAGVDEGTFELRRLSVPLLWAELLCLGLGALLACFVLFPEALGQERWSTAGRLGARGSSYVYFRAGPEPAIPRLGPTAFGPSRDH
jgi:hypothetical protein